MATDAHTSDAPITRPAWPWLLAIWALVTAINRAKPSGAKGTFIKKVSLSSTMGPGIKLDPATALNA